MFIFAILIAIVFISLIIVIINNSYVHAVKKAQKEIIDSLHEAIIIVDAHKNIVLYNNTAEKITGIAAKDAIGHPIDKVLVVTREGAIIPFDSYNQNDGVTDGNFFISHDGTEKTQ